jgi:hypothetical protein
VERGAGDHQPGIIAPLPSLGQVRAGIDGISHIERQIGEMRKDRGRIDFARPAHAACAGLCAAIGGIAFEQQQARHQCAIRARQACGETPLQRWNARVKLLCSA